METTYFLMVTVPFPLCWTTLSFAFCAPPPSMRALPVPRIEMASKKIVRWCTLLQVIRYRRTFADVTEPDILQGARTLAVNTLELLYTNDNIGDRSTVFQDEDSPLGSTKEQVVSTNTKYIIASHNLQIIIGVAFTSDIILLVAEVLGTRDG